MRISDWSSDVCSSDLGDMVKGIKAAFATRVNGIDWMAPDTKKEAIKKVETIVVGVGYPESWRDYGSYSVSAGNAYANEVAGQKAAYANKIAKISNPMDTGDRKSVG